MISKGFYRLLRRSLLGIYRFANWILAPGFEGFATLFFPSRIAFKGTVFVIGPPRSGSTLLMQVFTDAFDFGYLSNLHCWLFGAPFLVESIAAPSKRKTPSDYESNLGRAKNGTDPSECGLWWYRFFPRRTPYVTLNDVNPRRMRSFRRSLACFSKSAKRSLIFKNLFASLRLEPIAYYVPNALFVVIERDWVDNGQSLLKARFDALGGFGCWWSVPPPNVDELSRLTPVQQVVGQIESIHDLINRDVQRLGLEERTFRIRYEDFCEDVSDILNAFQSFMEQHGVELERRFEVPAQFPVRRSIKIPEPMYRELEAEVAKRQEKPAGERGAGG